MDVKIRSTNKDFLYLRERYKEIDLKFTDDVTKEHLLRNGIDRIERALTRFDKYDTGEIIDRESYYVKILSNLDDEDPGFPTPVEEPQFQKDLRNIRQRVRDLSRDHSPIQICVVMQSQILKYFRKARENDDTERLSSLYRIERHIERIIYEETGLNVTKFYTLNENIEELIRLIVNYINKQ